MPGVQRLGEVEVARFEEIVNIQPVSTATGAPEALESLASRLGRFEAALQKRLDVQAVERGKKTAQEIQFEKEAGITKAPEFKKQPLFFGTIEAKAHNQALRSAYIASVGTDIKEQVGLLEGQNPNDLLAFNTAIAGLRSGLDKSLDPSVKQQAIGFLDERTSAARIRVQNAGIKKQNDQAKVDLDIAVQSLTQDAVIAARGGDNSGSANALLDLKNTIQAQVDADFITEFQGQNTFRSAELAATQEVFTAGIRTLTDAGRYEDALVQIDTFRQKVPAGMAPDEHRDLIKSQLSDISQGLSLRDKIESEQEVANTSKQSVNYQKTYVSVLEGGTTGNDLTNMVRNGELSVSNAETLRKLITAPADVADDFTFIRQTTEAIRRGDDPEDIRQTIISGVGRFLKPQTGLTLLDDLDKSLDTESPLKTSNARRAEDFIVKNFRVFGPLGALDSDAEKRLARAEREFSTRVLNDEDPWLVADDLVGKDDFERAPNPIFGTKEDLPEAQDLLDEALIRQEISQEDYNFQFNNLEDLRLMKANIDSFNKAKGEALNGR